MSTADYARTPCVHCQGNAFRAEWREEQGLGMVRYVTCLNCGNSYPEFTAEQRKLLDEMDVQQDRQRQEAYGRMLDELRESARRFEVEKSVHRDDGVQVGWTRIGSFRTEQDAQDYIEFLKGEKVLGQGLVRILCEARELVVMAVGA